MEDEGLRLPEVVFSGEGDQDQDASWQDLEEQRWEERLFGGDDPYDDFDDDEPDEGQKKVKFKGKPEVAEVEVEQPPPPPSKLKHILNLIKIGLLFVSWCLCTIFLVTTGEHTHDLKLLSVPVDTPKFFTLPKMKTGKSIGVTIKGPFVIAEDLHTSAKREAPFLFASLLLVFADLPKDHANYSQSVSEVWQLELEAPSSRHIRETMKTHIFDLKADEGKTNAENVELQLELKTNVKDPVTLKVSFDESPLDKRLGIIISTIILIGLYIMIIWEIVDRTFAAMIASTVSIGVLAALNSRPSMATIMGWIDVETLLLLFGMMILVAILSESGVFDYLAVFAYKITKGHVWPLINCLCLFVAILSAILDNVTMMLLVTPVTIRLCEVTSLNPVPILMCMVIYSNVGAAMTPVGDPPNVIIATNHFLSTHGISFGRFFIHMFPGVLMAMVQSYLQLRFKYRNISNLETPEVEELKHEILVWERAAAGITTFSPDEAVVRETIEKRIKRLRRELKEKTSTKTPTANYQETLDHLEAEYPIRNKTLLVKSAIAFFFVVGLFALHSVPHLIHLSLGWTALLGAILLLILADIEDMEAVLARVEWSTLLFFAGLFILMEALTEMGLIEVIGDLTIDLILRVSPEHRLLLALLIILWVSAIASAFLDNIPVTSMMVKIIITLSQNKDLMLPLHPLVWALAFGVCFGGNGTLIGASANVVCAGVADQHGYKISFVDFFLVGFPIMLGSVATATVYLVLSHVVFEWHVPK